MDDHQLQVSSTKKTIDQSKLTAFSSPVILHKIFDPLSVKDLKSCRRVCQNWNNVATPLLGKKSHLSINKFGLKMEKHDLIESLRINTQLVRHIKLAYQEPVLSEATTTTNRDTQVLDTHFYAASVLYNEKLEKIRMQVDIHFLRMLGSLLGNHEFAKLRKIVLHEHNHPDNLDIRGNAGVIYCPTLQTMTSIQDLELSADEDRKGRTDFGYQSHPTFQQLIDNCPNLLRLKIIDNFYPDLSKCSKLKELQWSGFPYKKQPETYDEDMNTGRDDFKFDKLMELLDSVKHCLEVLELGIVYKISDEAYLLEYDDGLEFVPFSSVNCFPKLRRFTIGDFRFFQEVIESLNPNRFPTLEKLILRWEKWDSSNFYYAFKQFPREDNSIQALTTVESLTLDKLPIYKIARSFPFVSEVFPNVKELSVKFFSKDLSKGDALHNPVSVKELHGINSIFTAFVNLRRLTIHIHFRCTLSQLMHQILGPTPKGLTSLKLILDDSSLITDDGCNNFHTVFALCKSITFDGFLFKGNTVSTMNNFALVENVDLYFIN